MMKTNKEKGTPSEGTSLEGTHSGIKLEGTQIGK